MKSIVFGFSRPKSWKPFATLIMWNDKINYDHAYVKFPAPRWSSGFIYQASGMATNFEGQDRFEEVNEVVGEWMAVVPDDVEAYIGRLCLAREGKPYAILQVFGIIYMRLMWLLLGKTVKNPFANGDQETDCIEEVAYVLQRALNVAVPFSMDSITPKPFYEWLTKLPNVQRIR